MDIPPGFRVNRFVARNKGQSLNFNQDSTQEDKSSGSRFKKWIWEPALGVAALAALISLAIASPQKALDQVPNIEELPNSVREVIALQESNKDLEAFEIADGFKAQLFAWEPNIVNPIRMETAPNGAVFVSESYRWDLPWVSGAPDADAGLLDFLTDNSSVTQNRLKPGGIWQEVGELRQGRSERIRLLLDRDRDGVADTESNFAESFQGILDGVGGSLVYRDGEIWFAQSPQIWRLRDSVGDGVADKRRSILYGIGARLGGSGKPMVSSMEIGPDGLLYFAVGDRGIDRDSIRRINGIPSGIDLTRTGAVYSCELDGSNWSLLAWGLRAPADMAFNDLGDLFITDIVPTQRESGDSTLADEGSSIATRLYQVTPGADFGWRAGYSIPLRIKSTAAWAAEKNSFLALAPADNRTPPITTFPTQITGMAFTPGGTGFENEMGSESNGSTLVWSEVNSSWNDGAISLAAINLKGTAYTMGRPEKVLSPITAMDVVFDWQGGVLLADWTQGKEAPYKGRIFRVFSTNETARSGPAGLDRFINLRPELDKQSWLNWLSHPDSRVRAMAAISIAQRGQEWMSELETLLKASTLTTDAKSQLQAREAVRAMGLIAKQSPQAVNVLIQLARHPNAAIRAEIASALGRISGSSTIPVLMQGIQDVDPRVRRLSVESLGLLKVKDAIAPILDRARTIDGQDQQLRQSFVFALSNMATSDQLAKESTNPSASIRLVATLALQRIEGATTQVFLWDENPRVATEAARSVYANPNRMAFQRLADRIATPMDSPSLAYRALWAHHRLGDPIRARALAFFAANPNAPEPLRIEALQALSLWGKTLDRDPITGQPGWTPWFQSTPDEVEQTVNRAMSPYINSLRQDASTGVKDFFQSWRSPKLVPEESSSVPKGESKDASDNSAESDPAGGKESNDENKKTEENVKVIKT